MSLIYEFSNDGTTNVHENSVEGLCFGYSSVWCIKMQKHKGKNLLLTKPGQEAAYPLQQKVEQLSGSWDDSIKSVIKGWGHQCSDLAKQSYKNVPMYVALKKGHFIIDIGDHWVAAAFTEGMYAFFDANEGMTQFSSANSFKTGIERRLKEYKDEKPEKGKKSGWEDTHKLYKLTP